MFSSGQSGSGQERQTLLAASCRRCVSECFFRDSALCAAGVSILNQLVANWYCRDALARLLGFINVESNSFVTVPEE